MKIDIPEPASLVLSKLENEGFEAFVVGGCVRDVILGRSPSDWDVTTNATMDEVKRVFPRAIATGAKHGTVTVLIEGVGTGCKMRFLGQISHLLCCRPRQALVWHRASSCKPENHILNPCRRFRGQAVEVTTYRVDGEYKDNRRPQNVTYVNSLEQDLARRDFTMNAIAYNRSVGLVDLFGGTADIEARVVRCVGDADMRFREDALRMLRAVRFANTLDFDINSDTFKSICKNAHLLKNISGERISAELGKIFGHKTRLELLWTSGIIGVVFPELEECFNTLQNNPHHSYNVGEHTIKVVENLQGDFTLNLAGLLHDIGKPLCRVTDGKGIDHFYGHEGVSARLAADVLNRLKVDNKTKDKVLRLIKNHDLRIELTHKNVKRAVIKVGSDIFEDFLMLQRADARGQNIDMLEAKLQYLDRFKKIFDEIKGQPLMRRDLAITGTDLCERGYVGADIGKELERLLEIVIEEPSKNTRERLLKEMHMFNDK